GYASGAAMPPPPPPPLVRKRFSETAFWAPSVVTDADGRATVRFRMPDSTTTWRWMARGADHELLFGQAQAQSITRLDLVAELELPLAFVEGDRARIRTTAHNLGAQALDLVTRFAWQLAGKSAEATGSMKLAAGERQAAEQELPALVPGDLT